MLFCLLACLLGRWERGNGMWVCCVMKHLPSLDLVRICGKQSSDAATPNDVFKSVLAAVSPDL